MPQPVLTPPRVVFVCVYRGRSRVVAVAHCGGGGGGGGCAGIPPRAAVPHARAWPILLALSEDAILTEATRVQDAITVPCKVEHATTLEGFRVTNRLVSNNR